MKSIPIRSFQYTQEEPFPTNGFTIRNLTDLMDGADMTQDIHRHEFHFLLVLEKGQGEHEIDFVNYPVSDCCVYLMRPGQVHKNRLLAGAKGFLIAFQADFYPRLSSSFNTLNKQNFFQPNQEDFTQLVWPVKKMVQEYQAKKQDYHKLIKSYLDIFFLELNRIVGLKETSQVSYEHVRIDELLRLIEANAVIHKKTQYYANEMSLSVYQLNAMTKKVLGKTCSQLITDYLLLEAKRLLLATSLQVNEIAFQLGYDDPSYFIRFFKKQIGVSPLTFRNPNYTT